MTKIALHLYKLKYVDQWNRIVRQRLAHEVLSNLFSAKMTRIHIWERTFSSIMALPELDMHIQNISTLNSQQIQNVLKMNYKLRCKKQNCTTYRKKLYYLSGQWLFFLIWSQKYRTQKQEDIAVYPIYKLLYSKGNYSQS